MTKTEHQDAARRKAAEAGLPPDVHDPATLDAYAAFMEQRPAAAEESTASKSAAKRKAASR